MTGKARLSCYLLTWPPGLVMAVECETRHRLTSQTEKPCKNLPVSSHQRWVHASCIRPEVPVEVLGAGQVQPESHPYPPTPTLGFVQNAFLPSACGTEVQRHNHRFGRMGASNTARPSPCLKGHEKESIRQRMSGSWLYWSVWQL